MENRNLINIPIPYKQGLRIRKIWKLISFVNHSFKNYKIVEFEHKLQPKPIYLWFQLKGFFLKFIYRFLEKRLKENCFSEEPFFLVILQVSTDSQILKGSKFKDNFDFIYSVIREFYLSKLKNTKLVFKHHPRDRGYTNYSKFILKISQEFNTLQKMYIIFMITHSQKYLETSSVKVQY